MALTIYSIACVTFILVCLAMLWPIHAARQRVRRQIAALRAAEKMSASPGAYDDLAPDGLASALPDRQHP